MPPSSPKKPLTPATLHILLTLSTGPGHGYRIKREVEERTGGAVRLGAGTLYAGLQRMTREGLIEETEPPLDAEVDPRSSWRFYEITAEGRAALEGELARLEADLKAARALLESPA